MAESEIAVAEKTQTTHLQVFVRVRPLIPREVEHGDKSVEFKTKTAEGKTKLKIMEQNQEDPGAGAGKESDAPLSPRSKMVAKMNKRKKKHEHAYSSAKFSGVFSTEDNNERVYKETCEELAEYAVSGNSSMMFAYGNTGSGKTHTMLGYGDDRGMYYMAADRFCDIVQQINDENPAVGAAVRVQFAELYLDKAFDLLSDRSECHLRESEDGEFHFRKNAYKDKQGEKMTEAGDLTNVFCSNIDDIESKVKSGVENRAIGHSTFHNQSSRSHAVLEMQLTCKELIDIQKEVKESWWHWVIACNRDYELLPNKARFYKELINKRRKGVKDPCGFNTETEAYEGLKWATAETEKKEFKSYRLLFRYVHMQWKAYYEKRTQEISNMGGKIILVDLAGSEHGRNESRDLKQTAQEKREGHKINLSLLALNEVFRQKAAGKKAKYRDATLTKVLRDSLENDDCKCIMIAACSSSEAHVPMTVSTLNYAAQLAKCS